MGFNVDDYFILNFRHYFLEIIGYFVGESYDF